jgi:hypothetical protein
MDGENKFKGWEAGIIGNEEFKYGVGEWEAKSLRNQDSTYRHVCDSNNEVHSVL